MGVNIVAGIHFTVCTLLIIAFATDAILAITRRNK